MVGKNGATNPFIGGLRQIDVSWLAGAVIMPEIENGLISPKFGNLKCGTVLQVQAF